MTEEDTAPAVGPLRFAYLSGSPRIATRVDAEVSGPRAHILGMIEALEADGHHVARFILGDRLDRSVSGEGSRRLVTGGRARQLAVDVARLGLRVSAARQARRALEGPFDVVYERYALFQQLGRSFQRRGVPWVLETNAVMSDEARHERDALALQDLAARFERRAYEQADLVVAISEPLRALLVSRLGLPEDKILVVPNGVDLARFTPAATGAGDVAEGSELVVGFVGFVIERQGLDELIRAVAALRQQGHRVRGVVVGDGPDRGRLEKLAADQGVGEAMTFAGQVPWDDVPAWIASFSVGYSGQRGVGGMPMYHSPLKIYEYLAMARPVVASHHSDAARALVGSGAGWTFPPGDVDALVDVLGRLARGDTQTLTAAGDSGRLHVEREHSWRARCRQLTSELLARGLVTSPVG